MMKMNELLNNVGIDTDLLNKEPIHSRENTMQILGVSHTTLKKYENENKIKSSRFRRKKYYTTYDILNCVKTQLGITNQNEDWINIWK